MIFYALVRFQASSDGTETSSLRVLAPGDGLRGTLCAIVATRTAPVPPGSNLRLQTLLWEQSLKMKTGFQNGCQVRHRN